MLVEVFEWNMHQRVTSSVCNHYLCYELLHLFGSGFFLTVITQNSISGATGWQSLTYPCFLRGGRKGNGRQWNYLSQQAQNRKDLAVFSWGILCVCVLSPTWGNLFLCVSDNAWKISTFSLIIPGAGGDHVVKCLNIFIPQYFNIQVVSFIRQ